MTTIRGQLTRKLLLAIALLLSLGGIAVYLCARAALQGQFDAALHARAQALTTLTEQKGNRIELDFSEEHMHGFEARGTDFFELWQADGRTVERSRSLADAHLPLHHGTLAAPLFWNLPLPPGRAGRAVGLKFRPQDSDDKRRAGTPVEAVLVVASSRQHLDRTLTTLQLVLAGGGLLLLAATALVVPRVLRRELNPLQTLADEAARIDAASLSVRFPARNLPGELAPITARLNELLARLEDAFERERRFSSDVAHEFRTPVAELRSLAELAHKLPDARPANTEQEVLAIALHLESVLTRLLALARGERGGLPVRSERVAPGPLVQAVCDQFRAQAAARELAFHVNTPTGAEVETDPALLRSILTNLLDNAMEYTPCGGAVNVEASVASRRLNLRVVNSVAGLDERDLPRMFERFWRKDAARTPDGHTGLGLALALTFAHALGCELTASFVAPARLALTLSHRETQSPEEKTLRR
jgi:two-component system sensor histidine kinase QseC